MPSEPFEAEFFSSELSPAQDELYRMEGVENPQDAALGRSLTRPRSCSATVVNHDLEAFPLGEKLNLVKFEHGKGEDPREFSYGKKWYC